MTLTARAPENTTRFHREIIGSRVPDRGRDVVRLDMGSAARLKLQRDAATHVAPPRETGLLRVAFLLQAWISLAHWVRYAALKPTLINGASDYLFTASRSPAIALARLEGGTAVSWDCPWVGMLIANATYWIGLKGVAQPA